ncbi:hypothetical protein B0H13DRAFT_2348896 [Mycena leptocephala]|nr:hypothetical protein B0H13DRAFT_2348896 [Mycena leptocephala]
MRDFNFQNSDGFHPIPIFSIKDDVQWCSFNASPDEIDIGYSHRIMDRPAPRMDPTSLDTLGVHWDPNFLDYAVPYNPSEHWLGWMPTKRLPEDYNDPEEKAFDSNPIPLTEHWTDVQRSGGSDDGDSLQFLGYFLNELWTINSIWLSRHLRDISMTPALSMDFYGPNGWTTDVGDIPCQVEEQLLNMVHATEESAQATASDARRTILSQMAFVTWFITILLTWEEELHWDDHALVVSLHLLECPKKRVPLQADLQPA